MAEGKKKRRARGEGGIIYREDKKLWEARFVVDKDPGTGKDIRKSIYAKTQKEARKKLTEALAALDRGDYKEPCKLTVGQWLDIWAKDYLGGVKPYTVSSYTRLIKNHIKPALGAVRLEILKAHTIQAFYNGLGESRGDNPALSPKTVKNIHGVLHKALQQAVKEDYIRTNPADACTPPRYVRKEINPLDEKDTVRFVDAIKGHFYETLFLVTLFCGLRQGEVLGLTWDRVDFTKGTITINRQLQKVVGGGGACNLAPTKNGKGRVITPASTVIQLLKEQRRRQAEWQIKIGPAWGNDWGLVFTDRAGVPIAPFTLYKSFKRIAEEIGRPDARFHDLRHSYAVAAIKSGDDIKTVQGNLGHATASFTLDVYGHVTDQMKRESAERMEKYIKSIKTG